MEESTVNEAVTSKTSSYVAHSPVYEDEAEREAVLQRTEEIRSRGRLMPDSSLTTYFGKPAWHTYGRGNLNPAQGGLVYGDYLKSHNINPHSGANMPPTVQGFERTMRGKQTFKKPPPVPGQKKKQPLQVQQHRVRRPEPPRLSVKARAKSESELRRELE